MRGQRLIEFSDKQVMIYIVLRLQFSIKWLCSENQRRKIWRIQVNNSKVNKIFCFYVVLLIFLKWDTLPVSSLPTLCKCKFSTSLNLYIRASFVVQTVKKPACNAGDLGSLPGLGRCPGEGNGNPLQCSCLENPMDRGASWAAVHGAAKNWTRLSD